MYPKRGELKTRFDVCRDGLQTLFRPYQEALMEHIWGLNSEGRVGITSSQAYRFLHNHPDRKSRGTVISFLNEMVDEGILSYKERSGKGGYHRIYYPEMTKEEFGEKTVRAIVKKLMQVFPWVKISDVFSEN